MSRNSEFLTYKEYKGALKILEIIQSRNNNDFITPENEKTEKFIQASKRVHIIKERAKKSYNLNDITIKTWVKANDEFVKSLSKQEKLLLINLEQAYYDALENDDNCGICELQQLFNTLNEMNYTSFVNRYFEDCIIR